MFVYKLLDLHHIIHCVEKSNVEIAKNSYFI